MKKFINKSAHLLIIALAYLLINSSILAQAPQKMSYQAIIRNSNDSLLISTPVGMRISLVQSSPTGTVVYSETQTVTTNANGLVSLQIGMGTAVSGTFASIDWAAGPYYVKTETDLSGGTNYTITSSNEILSVPYALFSANGTPPGTVAGEINYWNGTAWVTVAPGLSLPGDQALTLSLCNGVPTWGPCPAVLPTVTTTAVFEINACNFQVAGTLNDNGGANLLSRGFCFSTSANPTLANSLFTQTANQQLLQTNYNFQNTTSFVANSIIYDTPLTPNTTYYVRAYATNSVGTSYGNELSFSTSALILTTTAVSGITGCSAQSGLESNGYCGEYGVCWSTFTNPTLENSSSSYTQYDGSSFTSSISGLTPNTSYYARAYVLINGVTYYGNLVSFTTQNLTTTSVSGITGSSAQIGVEINGNCGGNPSGVCWSTSSNPTIADSSTNNGVGMSFTSSISGLAQNTTYYVRAYATYNGVTYYGNQVSFTTSILPCIGQSYQGGIVAYILQAGDPGYDANVRHGLIAAPSDQGIAQWGCYGTGIAGADGTAIGTGAQNTIDIMNGCSEAGIAARLCGDLVLGGYSDWYLPSMDELNQLYINKDAIGGFAYNYYWSSTEYGFNFAWKQSFTTGYQSSDGKNFYYVVRAVRAF